MARNSACRVPCTAHQNRIPSSCNQELPLRQIAHLHDKRTYIQRPVRIIHSPTNNLIFMHEDTSNGHFIGGQSLLCLSRSVQCLHPFYIIDLAYHIKGSSHMFLMVLVMQKIIFLLRFNSSISNPHDDQSLISRTQ